MFRKILIANRGEIALRVIRACREMGIASVAVFSEADRNSLHVRYADEAYCIGRSPASDSYLNIPRIIAACEVSDADAVHPGYGFLSENAHFAEIINSCDMTFIGPTSEAIAALGDKANARDLAIKHNVPVVPGSNGPVNDYPTLVNEAARIGYPIIVKASAGGGGRGMRVVRNEDELQNAFETARKEAEAAFGNPEVYIEKFLERSRHVEVQILADKDGTCVHLGERDCTMQRRHQKLLEESPSPIVDEKRRKEMGEAACRIALAANYVGAGTVEFIVDEDTNDYYFMEMNARVQVEHGVTEMEADVDIVRRQIMVAAGEPLGLEQKDIHLSGWTIECRINAEDPEHDFRPNPGKITTYNLPGGPGVRVDSIAYAGYEISPYYDSMVAKLMVHSRDRIAAIRRMLRALDEFEIGGIKTTIPLFKNLLKQPAFIRGDRYNTNFVEEWLKKQ
ncbi:acetyl-CoA carboxylase biotin carboxylase subunit [bacterium]|nr:acetyl-CoA carboxylase biotin carboxylase subunit [bacterium]